VGGLGCLEGVMMVSESLIMAVLALQFGFMSFILMKLDAKKTEAERFQLDVEKMLSQIRMPEVNIDSIKDELLEVVEDLIANMRVPTALDHGMGMLQQFMGMKHMRMAQDLGLAGGPTDEDPPDSNDV